MGNRPVSQFFGIDSRNLRIETLTRLRWLALFGQLVTVLAIAYGLRFHIPLHWCLLVISASVVLNVVVDLYFPRSLRLEDRPATALLLFDIIQLSILLFLVGGLDNPFAILLLAPVTIASVSLQTRQIIGLVFIVILCVSILSIFHWPLPWYLNQTINLPTLYRLGFWAALIVATIFISTYAAQVAREARNLSLALTATEVVLEHQNHLSRLDGLAAAAAHELGTPLATISVVSRELSHSKIPSEFVEDINLLVQEAQRCREILGRLASLSDNNKIEPEKIKLRHLIEGLIAPIREQNIEIYVNCVGNKPEPLIFNNQVFSYGIFNFVENAAEFAKTFVVIDLIWTIDEVKIKIADDGPGFPTDVLAQIGEPYLRSRGRRPLKTGNFAGLGLGIFIAKTLLERTGARLQFSNEQCSGASVQISWKRLDIEKGPEHPFFGISSVFSMSVTQNAE